MLFRVYYGDGSMVESDDPASVPVDNVQAIAWNDPTRGYGDIGRVVLREWDFYLWTEAVGEWHGTNKFFDVLQHIRANGIQGVQAILFGQWIAPSVWREIIRRAETEPGLDAKNAGDALREDGRE